MAGAWPRPALLYVYAVLIGLGYAATAPLTPAVASDLFGGPRFPRIFGVLHATNSFGGAVGVWTAGYIFDVTGSYALGLWVTAFTAVCAPALLWWRRLAVPTHRLARSLKHSLSQPDVVELLVQDVAG